MDSQTPNDYKEYFLNKFKNLFQTFTNECYDNVQNDDIKNDLGINDYGKYGKVVDPNDKVQVIKTGISHGVEKATDEVFPNFGE